MSAILIVLVVIGGLWLGLRAADWLLNNAGCAGFMLIVFMLFICRVLAG